MTCQEAIDVMEEALEGRLEASLRPGFDEHLAECRPCDTYFGHLRVTRRALGSLARAGESNPRRSQLVEAFRKEFGPSRD